MLKHAEAWGASNSLSNITQSDFTRSLHNQANNSWSWPSFPTCCGNPSFPGTWTVLKLGRRGFRSPLVHRSLLHSYFRVVVFGPRLELLEVSLHVLACVWSHSRPCGICVVDLADTWNSEDLRGLYR